MDDMTLPDSPDELAADIHRIRSKMKELNDELNQCKAKLEKYESKMIVKMDELGTNLMRINNLNLTVSINENVVPTVVDWDAFEQYVQQEDALYLYQRRLSASAWRELVESKNELVPGTEPYRKRTLSVRSLG